MLNEEGGIDPEQFRMEAMFDRMDALGKSVLGLTIQCCQCHNHKFDPITQEEYYRLFAFLNNDHEPQIVGLYARGVERCATVSRGRSARSKTSCSKRRPTGPNRWPTWEEPASRRPAASGKCSPPEAYEDTGGGAKLSLLKDQLDALRRLRADALHVSRQRQDRSCPAITAVRLELLTDPEPAARRAGPLVQGHLRPDARSRSKPPADGAEKNAEVKIADGHGRLRAGRNAAGAEFRRPLGQAARRRAGEVRHRRQGRDRLGHRRRARPPQSGSQSRVSPAKSRSSSPPAPC